MDDDVEHLCDRLAARLRENMHVACVLEMRTNDELLATRTGVKLARVVD